MKLNVSSYMQNGSHRYQELKKVCGEHSYAIEINGEIGWEDNLIINELPALCKLHGSNMAYIYSKQSDELKVWVNLA